MAGVKLTIGRLLLIGIYWSQSTNRRFIYFHLFIHSHKGGLTIGPIRTYQKLGHPMKQVLSRLEMLEMETILHTCLEFISNNTNIFKKLLASSTAHISRASVKQYWHFERVTGKQYCKRFQISYHYKIILTFSKSYYQAVFTLSQSYYQTILNTFLRSLNGHSNRQKILKQKIPK